MIDLTLRLDNRGILRECSSYGHAETGPAGTDIVCASVSILLRSCARTLEGREGVVVSGTATEPGRMVFRVESCPVQYESWLAGVGDSLITGLSDLAHEYPEACGLEIIRNTGKEL